MNFNADTLQHNNEFIIIIFCYLMVPVITMCNLLKRLIRATFLSTPARAVDKTRNMEHSGTCRNIPEHPGTSRNMKKLKYFFMKK